MSSGDPTLDIICDGDAVTLDAIASGCVPRESTYAKRDFLTQPGHWRGQTVYPLAARPWLIRNRTVVIGHSDYPFRGTYQVVLEMMGARRIFAVNTTPRLRNVRSLPLGLTNKTQESPLHEILGNQKHFASAYQLSDRPSRYMGRVYANFTDSTSQRER